MRRAVVPVWLLWILVQFVQTIRVVPKDVGQFAMIAYFVTRSLFGVLLLLYPALLALPERYFPSELGFGCVNVVLAVAFWIMYRWYVGLLLFGDGTFFYKDYHSNLNSSVFRLSGTAVFSFFQAIHIPLAVCVLYVALAHSIVGLVAGITSPEGMVSGLTNWMIFSNVLFFVFLLHRRAKRHSRIMWLRTRQLADKLQREKKRADELRQRLAADNKALAEHRAQLEAIRNNEAKAQILGLQASAMSGLVAYSSGLMTEPADI